MSRFACEKDTSLTLAAGAHWRDAALVQERSVFTLDNIWTTSNIQTLNQAFTLNPDETDRSFIEKLKDQIEACSPAVKILAGEMVWLLLLCPSNSGAKIKRTRIKEIWDWSGAPWPEGNEWLSDEALRGIGSGGPGFNNYRPRELTFALNFLLRFRSLSEPQRNKLIGDPWKFAEWLQEVPDAQSRQFRHMLLHVLFPDDFERVFSAGDRAAIAEHFAETPRTQAMNMPAVELDKLLRNARTKLEMQHGTKELDYYCSPLKGLWQHDIGALSSELTREHVVQAAQKIDHDGIPAGANSTTYDIIVGEKRYPPKLVLSYAYKNLSGKELPRSEFSGGEDTIAFKILRDLGFAIVPKDFVGDLIEKFLAQADAGADLRTSTYPKNYRDMRVKVSFGQGAFSRVPWIAFLAEDQRVSEGVYPVLLYYREAKLLVLAYGISETHPPKSRWKNVDQLTTVGAYVRERTGQAAERYGDSLVAVAYKAPDEIDLEQLTAQLDAMIVAYADLTAPGTEQVIGSAGEPFSIESALKDIFVEPEFFTNLLERLKLTKNIVLQGPPGVGKTFLARRLAYAFLGRTDGERVQMVQFHASYAYEDFVQGYRPDGKGGFARKDGVFLRFCRDALADIGRPYVFIIDEINRANLSKVFGELLMLIERDKRTKDYAVDLAYSTEDDTSFFVPDNVFIVGLMNTADRSLALVDYALRRRFDFFTVNPGFNTAQFTEFMKAKSIPDALLNHLREHLSKLNKVIDEDHDLGPGFRIGHSYFCELPGDDAAEDAYNQVIEHQIAPCLREYWFEGARAEEWRQRLFRK